MIEFWSYSQFKTEEAVESNPTNDDPILTGGNSILIESPYVKGRLESVYC